VEGRNTVMVNRGIETEKNGIKIKGIRAFHDDESGTKRGEVVLFKFRVDGVTFCHLGDLGHVLSRTILEEIGRIDILFVPVGNVFTIGPKKAWRVISDIRPTVAVPMHYRIGGLSLSIKPVDPFLEEASSDSVVRVGNEMHLEREDLPERFEVWVFSM
jgi:L-ascorbate metabolism protein UlaG (beta-lactamase superfamily)